jgi:hypothetical protein
MALPSLLTGQRLCPAQGGYRDASMGLLNRLRGGHAVPLEAGAEMLIGAPANPPSDELVSRLRTRCGEHPEIERAYLYQVMFLQEGEEPHLALGLLLDGSPDIEPIADDLAEHAHPLRPEDPHLTIHSLTSDALESVAASVAPLYERSR